MRLFSDRYLNDENYCKNTTGAEDADLQNCLNQIGITPGETRDRFGKERFHPLSFQKMWSLPPTHWTYKHSKHPIKTVC